MPIKILLISAEAKTAAALKQALPDEQITVTGECQAALRLLPSDRPALVFLDHDLPGIDEAKFFRQVRLAAPRIPIIVISADNNIPLAVAVTRLGAADFLKKPLTAEQISQAVARIKTAKPAELPGQGAAYWLRGESAALHKFYQAAEEAVTAGHNILLLTEPGIDARPVAEYLHARSARPRRQITALDLASFNRAGLEGSFWTTLQELLAEPADSAGQSEEDLTGTLLLENIATLEKNFQASIFSFLRERRGRIDKDILAVVAACDSGFLAELDTESFKTVEVPPLRQRKEDLPLLIVRLLADLSLKHDCNVGQLSLPALEALSLYDYPGNYQELRDLLEHAVLLAEGAAIGLKELAFDRDALIAIGQKRALISGEIGLVAAQKSFEKTLYETVTAKADGDVGSAARFLDLPKNTLTERLTELRSDPLN
jgi:DNA-binding NtrC family response regulator